MEPRNCASCNAPKASSRCGACRSVSYCDKECQREHWKTHKKECSFKTKKKRNAPPKITETIQNDDDSQSKEIQTEDIKTALTLIGDHQQPHSLRVQVADRLLLGVDAARFLKVEQQGLWKTLNGVLSFALRTLTELKSTKSKSKKNGKSKSKLTNQQIVNVQRFCGEFAGSIALKTTVSGERSRDQTIELKSLKLLARSSFWSTNLKILGMKEGDAEYKRRFLKLLSCILNWNSCGLYVLTKLTDLKGNKEHKQQIDNLIALCNDRLEIEDKVQGTNVSVADGVQSVANQCFCQLYAHCERCGKNKALKKYLDSKKNVFFMFSYPMATAQMQKGGVLSVEEIYDRMGDMIDDWGLSDLKNY